jgi:hypothetical protein
MSLPGLERRREGNLKNQRGSGESERGAARRDPASQLLAPRTRETPPLAGEPVGSSTLWDCRHTRNRGLGTVSYLADASVWKQTERSTASNESCGCAPTDLPPLSVGLHLWLPKTIGSQPFGRVWNRSRRSGVAHRDRPPRGCIIAVCAREKQPKPSLAPGRPEVTIVLS